MEKNCQKIYDIIVTSGKVTTKFIKEYLDDRTDVHNRIIEREAEAEGERRYNHGDFTSIDRENFIKKSINEKRKYTISVRTIQRCLQNDSRIIKKGKYYTVDEETRFETRYRNPQRFGYFISDEVIYNKGYGYDKTAMEKMINIFGAITLFVFIEAAKPFKDKFNFENKKNGFLDRRDYIKYWALNAIPLKSMFEAFTLVFTNEVPKKKSGTSEK